MKIELLAFGERMSTEKRKSRHLRISLEENVQFKNKSNGLRDVWLETELIYKALPEINKEEIDTTTEFLGKEFKAPAMVSGISGGVQEAKKLNIDIAQACETLGIGMGLGSLRSLLENEKNKELKETYFVRDIAPNIFVAGNLGVTQLKEFAVEKVEKILNDLKVDALAIHLNAAQEVFQPKGDTNFKSCLKKIKEFSEKLKLPVYVKEVGHGISYEIAREVAKTNVKAIDVQGAGGTSWIGVEALNSKNPSGKVFWDFGIPTSASILECKKAFKGPIIASGGIRNGLDAVKALVLGASIVGIAMPVLKAQHKAGAKGVQKYLQKFIEEIKIAMFLVGAKNLKELKKKKYVLLGKTRDWAEQRKL